MKANRGLCMWIYNKTSFLFVLMIYLKALFSNLQYDFSQILVVGEGGVRWLMGKDKEFSIPHS